MAEMRESRVIGAILALLLALLIAGFVLNGAYERLRDRYMDLREEQRLLVVYVNDLWRRMVEAGIDAPPPPPPLRPTEEGEDREE
jgi:hypothetical protein